MDQNNNEISKEYYLTFEKKLKNIYIKNLVILEYILFQWYIKR